LEKGEMGKISGFHCYSVLVLFEAAARNAIGLQTLAGQAFPKRLAGGMAPLAHGISTSFARW
jgi:hypothetical protein